MKTLLAYLKGYKKESILAPLFKMLEASFELFVPLVMAAIIDVGIANHDKPNVFCTDRAGNHRTCLFHYSTVFCSEGSNRSRNGNKTWII